VRTYLLVHTEPGRAAEACRAITEDQCVHWADTVAGAYDVIAEVEVDGSCELHELVARLRGRAGVTRLAACPAASNRSLWEELPAESIAGS
jgi:hypothetical protein